MQITLNKMERYNTGETPQELKELYNPEGSLLRQVQLRMLDMLLYLDKVCKENHISYRIDGGTVLGAVRHGGFIPWDDDVDVVVESPKDYKRLCRILKKNPHPQYVLQDDRTDRGCIKHWSVLRDLKSEYIHLDPKQSAIDLKMKYRGMQVDIFPYRPGVIPSIYYRYALLGRRERYWVVNKFWAARALHIFRRDICTPLLNLISKFFGDKNYYMHTYGEGFFPCRFHKNLLLPHKPIMFEGHEFPGPSDPYGFCKVLYGDYMDLPPKEKRNHHMVTYKIWD